MTTQEILAECDMRGLVVCVIRVMPPGHPQAWSAAIGADAAPHAVGASFAAALVAAWRAYEQRAVA